MVPARFVCLGWHAIVNFPLGSVLSARLIVFRRCPLPLPHLKLLRL